MYKKNFMIMIYAKDDELIGAFETVKQFAEFLNVKYQTAKKIIYAKANQDNNLWIDGVPHELHLVDATVED